MSIPLIVRSVSAAARGLLGCGSLLTFASVNFAAAADVEVTDLAFDHYRRAGGGWEAADTPAVGTMVAVRCDYRVTGSGDGPPSEWSLAFLHGDKELARTAGAGLTDTRTGTASRTWYGTLLGSGAHEITCVVDAGGELDEDDESNNRRTRTLNVPAPANARTTPPAGPVFGTVTPRQAALVRGAPPAIDLAFTAFAGIKQAGAARGINAPGTLASARTGETLALNCSYRAYVGGPNGELLRVPEWRVSIEGDGVPQADSAGQRDLVSVDGASPPGHVVRQWTPDAPGRRTVRCVLDPDNVVAETDETNNVLELSVDVVAKDARVDAGQGIASASLAFTAVASPSLEQVMGPVEMDVYRSSLKVNLVWKSAVAADFDWRWQASLWPFPADPDEPPQALLANGLAKSPTFTVDLASFPPLGKTAAGRPLEPAPAGARTATEADTARQAPVRQAPVSRNPPSGELPPAIGEPAAAGEAQAGKAAPAAVGVAPVTAVPDVPMDFYIRIRPYSGGKPAGPPSNAVVAHYLPGKSPIEESVASSFAARAEQQQKHAEMSAAARVYKLELEGFTQAVFPEPIRWGCVVVLSNPHKGLHPLANYKADGKTVYCPQKDPSKQQKDLDEKILQGIEGFGKAWDGLAWVYDQGKNWVASQFAEFVPCEWLGDLEADCESAAKTIAGTAISVGLAAAGVPPTLPDVEALGELAKGEAVAAAVDFTCEAIESEGGKCTPEMRDGLAELYGEGLDQMQSAAKQEMQEPNCGDVQMAKELGLLPMPCFTAAGVEVAAAPGAVEEPPAVQVRVTRIAPEPDFAMDCELSISLLIENDVPNKGLVRAYPWPNATVAVPPLSVNQSQVVDLALGARQPFSKGHLSGPIVSWVGLLKGATGKLVTSTNTGQAVAPGPNGPVRLTCSEALEHSVQIPGTLGMESTWTVKAAN